MSLSRLLLAALLTGSAFAAPKARLAEVQDVSPAGYRAELTLDPAKTTFSGRIVIRLDVRQPLDIAV